MMNADELSGREGCVVSFLPNWYALQHDDITALRHHVMRLRIRLVIVSDHAIWCCSPAEDVEWFVTAGARHERLLQTARDRFGVRRVQHGIMVLEADGSLRFDHVRLDSLRQSLLEGLEECPGAASADPVLSQVVRALATRCQSPAAIAPAARAWSAPDTHERV
jgi:hypothetical protein